MSWTFCTSGAAIVKAGVNANSNIVISGAILAKWSDEAEGNIEAMTRRTWLDSYSSLPTGIKNQLSNICSSMIAKQIIDYDMSGYSSLAEATLMMNVQDDIVREGITALSDFKSNTLKTP
jgi:hypothetical protein